MRGVAREDQGTRFRQFHEQRLMPGVCPGVEMSVTLPSPNTS
jgi:hypothetical protein